MLTVAGTYRHGLHRRSNSKEVPKEEQMCRGPWIEDEQVVMQAECFIGRDPGFVKRVAACVTKEVFAPGDMLMKEGEPGFTMYFLVRGRVEVLVGADQKQVAILDEGSAFGEMALFGLPRRAATIRALLSCECRVINLRDFGPLLQKFPVERHFFEALARDRRKQLEEAKQHADKQHLMEFGEELRNLSVAASSQKVSGTCKGGTVNEGILNGVDFSGCNPGFLKQLAVCLEPRTFKTGDNILIEGEEGYLMYFLLRGSVEVVVGDQQKRVAVLKEGSTFGEMALFGMPRRTATIRAMEMCDCRVVNYHDFNVILQRFPEERVYFASLAQERQLQLDEMKPPSTPHVASHSGGAKERRLAATNGSPTGFHICNAGQILLRSNKDRTLPHPTRKELASTDVLLTHPLSLTENPPLYTRAYLARKQALANAIFESGRGHLGDSA